MGRLRGSGGGVVRGLPLLLDRFAHVWRGERGYVRRRHNSVSFDLVPALLKPPETGAFLLRQSAGLCCPRSSPCRPRQSCKTTSRYSNLLRRSTTQDIMSDYGD